MPPAWFWRKVRQLCDGWPLDLGRMVAVEACNPSLASSSRMRGLPQVGLTLHIRRMSWINFRVLCGSPTPPSGLPSPEHPESGSLPADDSLWPEEDQWCFPSWPSSLQHHPETSIPPAELWPWRSPLKDRDLVPQGQNFQRDFVPTPEQGPRVDQHDPEKCKHTSIACSQIPTNQSFQLSTEFLPPTASAW